MHVGTLGSTGLTQVALSNAACMRVWSYIGYIYIIIPTGVAISMDEKVNDSRAIIAHECTSPHRTRNPWLLRQLVIRLRRCKLLWLAIAACTTTLSIRLMDKSFALTFPFNCYCRTRTSGIHRLDVFIWGRPHMCMLLRTAQNNVIRNSERQPAALTVVQQRISYGTYR